MASRKLSPKQEAFVREYLLSGNATEAYKLAGYKVRSDHYAQTASSRLMLNDVVAARIAELQAKVEKRTIATAERLELELERIALSDPRKLFNANGAMLPPNEWDDDTAAAVGSTEVFEEFEGSGEARTLVGYTKKVKAWDKCSALVALLKRRDNAKAAPPPPIPGSSPENPLHVSAIHDVAPAAIRSFIGDLRRAGIDGASVAGIPPDGVAKPVDPKNPVAKGN